MDFASLDLRTAAEKEYWVQLRLGDVLLYSDMEAKARPCEVKLLSPANPKVKSAIQRVTRLWQEAGALGGKLTDTLSEKQRAYTRERQAIVAGEIETAIAAFLTTVITDWRNIERDGKALPFSAETLEDYAQPGAPFARLAAEIIEDVANTQDVFTPAAKGS